MKKLEKITTITTGEMLMTTPKVVEAIDHYVPINTPITENSNDLLIALGLAGTAFAGTMGIGYLIETSYKILNKYKNKENGK